MSKERPVTHMGFVVPEDSPKVEVGHNPNEREYKDPTRAKTNFPAICLLEDGKTPKYAADGLTQDWYDTHPRPTEKEKENTCQH